MWPPYAIHLLYDTDCEMQDQRRLGAIIVPNKEEALLAAKRMSIIDANAVELSKEKMSSLLYEELRAW